MIRFGWGGSKALAKEHRSQIMLSGGSVVFHGKACFAEGTILTNGGDLVIGDHFSTNKNCFISCHNKLHIGRDVLLGWNVQIMDDNGGTHKVYHNGIENDSCDGITIGDHVWLCSYSNILKGAGLERDSVLAWRSVLTKRVETPNVLVAGMPAKVVREDISWKL